jgi:hypothetical protein
MHLHEQRGVIKRMHKAVRPDKRCHLQIKSERTRMPPSGHLVVAESRRSRASASARAGAGGGMAAGAEGMVVIEQSGVFAMGR